ncbi:MAG: hypothetical protein RL120_17960 [Gammaproteobacteria bacterium]
MNKAIYGSVLAVILSSSIPVTAQPYPDMVGLWAGTVRVVSSGNIERDRLDRGGIVISEVNLELRITVQDGETFVGRTRSFNQNDEESSIYVWGSIRSTGDEALFITEIGGRGHIWFEDADEFEYCLTNLNDEVLTSYCARLHKIE